MTLQEAKKQIDTSENRIKSSFADLRSAADKVGTSAVSSASSTTSQRTLGPLSISVIGLILLAVSTFAGIACIIGGIFIAYKSHQSASSIQKKIMESYRHLTSQINSHHSI